jgi:hypothetical protein
MAASLSVEACKKIASTDLFSKESVTEAASIYVRAAQTLAVAPRDVETESALARILACLKREEVLLKGRAKLLSAHACLKSQSGTCLQCLYVENFAKEAGDLADAVSAVSAL